MRHFEDLDLALYSKITKFETDADKQKQIIDVVFFAMEAVAEKLQSQVEQQAAQTTMQPEIKTLQVENKCLSDSCREVTIKYRDTKFHLSEAVKNYADIFNQLSAANQRIQELLDLVEVVERRNKQLEERIRVADAEIKRLQGWVDVLEKPKVWSQAEIEAIKGSGLEYSMYLAEESLLVHRVVEEVQALRRGVGVSYAINDDPVEKLAKKLPPVENVVSTLAMIKAAMQKQLLKEK